MSTSTGTADAVSNDQEVSGSVESDSLTVEHLENTDVNPVQTIGRFASKTDEEITTALVTKSQTWFKSSEKTRAQEMELTDYVYSSTFTNEILAEKINLRTVTVSKVAHWNKTGSVRNTMRQILGELDLTKKQTEAVGNLQKLGNITLSLSDLAMVTTKRLNDEEFGEALALTIAQGGQSLKEIKEDFPTLWDSGSKGPKVRTEAEIIGDFLELAINKMNSRKIADKNLFSSPASLQIAVDKAIAVMGTKNLIVRGKTNGKAKVVSFTTAKEQTGALNMMMQWLQDSFLAVEEAVSYTYNLDDNDELSNQIEKAVTKQQNLVKKAREANQNS